MWAGLFILGVWLLAAIKHGYLYMPSFELKRRASRGNPILRKIAPTAPYQPLINHLFNILIFITSLGLIVYLNQNSSKVNTAVLLIVGFAGLIYFSNKNIALVVKFCAWLNPYLMKLLLKLNPIYLRIVKMRRHKPVTTDIYEREDLKRFLAKQKTAVNNRISDVDLDAVMHVLEFEHRKIATVMVPYKKIRFVNAKEPIGPILLSELHKSGHKEFPVLGNSKHEILGVLSLETLAEYEEGGVVTDAMNDSVIYVRDNQPLEQVLQAFTQTGRHLFMVIDMREKVVGLITIRDVLEEIIGHTIHGEYVDYTSTETVAHQ